MKVCITNQYKSWDASKTGKGFFIQRLIPALEKLGVEVTTSPGDKVDINLSIGKNVYDPVNATKKVLRLGPAHIGKTHKKGNEPKVKALRSADGVIYQSEFGKRMCDKFLGKAKCKTQVIYNGVEPVGLQPHYKTPYSFLASTRKWTKQKRLKDILKAYQHAAIPESVLYVAGEVERKLLKKFKGTPGVWFLGCLEQKALTEYLLKCQTLISVVWLDCMPNSVCEALVSGCRVITNSTGGTAEIAPDMVVKEKPWTPKVTDNDHPPKLDTIALANLMIDSVKMPLPKSSHVHIDTIAQQYKEFFEEVLRG